MNVMIKKISLITICIAVIAFAVFASVETVTFSRTLKNEIDSKLFYETKKIANQMSMVFENAEGSVDTLCAEISHNFDIHRQLQSPEYITSYMTDYSPVIRDALADIEDSQGLYMTFSPDITDRNGAYEIWYSYDRNGELAYTDATSNGIYYESFEDESFPTMHYYFGAIANPGEGIWTEPYMDSDIGREVIAYSRAVYSDGILIGVVGTDIYTEHTVSLIDDMKTEHDGMIFLLNEHNDLIIASDNAARTDILDSTDLWKSVTRNMNGRDDGIFDAEWHGNAMRVSFSRLSNDWKLAIISDEDTLYATLDHVLGVIIALSFTMIVLLAFAIFFAVQHLSSPVDKAVKMLKMLDLDDHLEHSDAAGIRDDTDIEALVKKAVERQRMNDIVLASQARLASAGEMMSAITHQWKQPLNNINIVMGNLKDDILSGELDEENALYAVSRVEKLTTGMSETLGDFTEYLKPDTKLVAFSVIDVINAAAELLRDRIRPAGITLDISADSSLMSCGYRNSLYHVILNVLGNAIDAISEKGAGSGLISIDVRRSETEPGRLIIEIFNDGVPLSESVRQNLFKPYYTTKSGSDGTGLGLAISRHFIEESMDGRITLENCSGGVKCTIVINEYKQVPAGTPGTSSGANGTPGMPETNSVPGNARNT